MCFQTVCWSWKIGAIYIKKCSNYLWKMFKMFKMKLFIIEQNQRSDLPLFCSKQNNKMQGQIIVMDSIFQNHHLKNKYKQTRSSMLNTIPCCFDPSTWFSWKYFALRYQDNDSNETQGGLRASAFTEYARGLHRRRRLVWLGGGGG